MKGRNEIDKLFNTISKMTVEQITRLLETLDSLETFSEDEIEQAKAAIASQIKMEK